MAEVRCPIEVGREREYVATRRDRHEQGRYITAVETPITTAQTIERLRLFTLNISGPSLPRAGRLLSFLNELDPDVIVLTETRSNLGTAHLLASYRHAGYHVASPEAVAGGERGVAIIQRVPAAETPRRRTADLAHRLLISRLGLRRPITLVGAYVPSRDASAVKIERKQTFLAQMTRLLRRISQGDDVILMGDFNIVSRSHVPRYPSFRSWEYESLEHIAACGFVDAFAELNPGVQVYSWVGRTGDGYRYDYGFMTRGLLPQLRECEYINAPRELGLSDHAGVLLTISAEGERLAVRTPEPETQDTLAIA